MVVSELDASAVVVAAAGDRRHRRRSRSRSRSPRIRRSGRSPERAPLRNGLSSTSSAGGRRTFTEDAAPKRTKNEAGFAAHLKRRDHEEVKDKNESSDDGEAPVLRKPKKDLPILHYSQLDEVLLEQGR